MSLHTWCHQGLHKPSRCATFTLNSHWGRAATGKIVSHLCAQGRFHHVPLFVALPGFSVRERASQGRHTEVYWPILVAIPFYSTIFPAALAANSPEYLLLPEPLKPKQLYHFHNWTSQGHTQVLQGSLRNKPRWTTHLQTWN